MWFRGAVRIATTLLVVAMGMAAAGCVRDAKRWEALSLVDGTVLFGIVDERTCDDVLLVTDVRCFVDDAADVAEPPHLARPGAALDDPLDAVIVPEGSVATRHPLEDDAPARAVPEGEASPAPCDIGRRPSFRAAVFLLDGRVYFGTASLRDGSVYLKNAAAPTRDGTVSMGRMPLGVGDSMSVGLSAVRYIQPVGEGSGYVRP